MRIYGLIHLMPVMLHLVAGNGLQTELSMEAAFQGEFISFNKSNETFAFKQKHGRFDSSIQLCRCDNNAFLTSTKLKITQNCCCIY